MKFDLHFHTTLSDGMKTSSEAVEIAAARGIQFMACTDHDIINTEITRLAKKVWIETVEWVEISSSDYSDNTRGAHLTCYSRKFQGRIFSILDGVQEARRLKIQLQVQKLREGGFYIEETEFFSYWEKWGSNLSNLNNGHIRRYLFLDPRNEIIAREKMWSNYSACTFISQALSRNGDFSHIGSVDNLPDYESSVELCGELARENNAILSVAHPNHTFKTQEEFLEHIPSYVERWINAIEIHFSTPSNWIEVIDRTCKRFELLITFWSDCHMYTHRDKKHGIIGDMNPHIDQFFIDREFQRFQEFLLL